MAKPSLSYLQQKQHVVHEVETLLGVAAYEDREAVLRVVEAESQKTRRVLEHFHQLQPNY